MPVPPAELTAEFTIHPFEEGNMQPHVRAGVDAARTSGLAIEVGPLGTGLSGARDDVLRALHDVMVAALDAGARAVHVKVEAPSEAR
ncbi:MAG TPA: thiamine-binding protein [Actinomycetota bacterium]|nr:thiamine-binding protein [Actinomycetota bacterium]